jgi:hypothetical protein
VIIGSFRPKSTHCPAPGTGIVDDELRAPLNIEHADTSTSKDKKGARFGPGARKCHDTVGNTSVGAESSIDAVRINCFQKSHYIISNVAD